MSTPIIATELPVDTTQLSGAKSLLDHYINDIRNYPLLDATEQEALVVRAQLGDDTAHTQLVQSNLRLVIWLAQKYTGFGLSLMDLIQEGNLGLLTAITGYKTPSSSKFSSYASKRIRGCMLRALTNQARTVRIPCNAHSLLLKIKHCEIEYFSQHGKFPTEAEISLTTGIPQKRIREILEAPAMSEELSPEIKNYSITTNGHATLDTVALNNVLNSSLDAREKHILQLRFGLNGEPQITLKEIGKLYNLTKERIRCIQNQAFKRKKR